MDEEEEDIAEVDDEVVLIEVVVSMLLLLLLLDDVIIVMDELDEVGIALSIVPDEPLLSLEVVVVPDVVGNGAVVIGLNGFVKRVNEAIASSRPTS